jgi:Domain of unknown function (DUF4136)
MDRSRRWPSGLREINFMKRRCTILFLLVALQAATAGDTKTALTRGRDLSHYKTYQWLPPRVFGPTGMVEDDPEFAPMIRKAVNRELAAKGYKEVAEGGELKVVSAGVGRTSSQLEGWLMTFGFDYYSGFGTMTAAPINRVNKDGTLLVALVDAKDNKSIWSGYSTEALNGPGSVEKAINKTAARLFKKLPPQK